MLTNELLSLNTLSNESLDQKIKNQHIYIQQLYDEKTIKTHRVNSYTELLSFGQLNTDSETTLQNTWDPYYISYFLSKSITLSKITSAERNVSLIPIPDKTPIDEKHPALIPSNISFCASPILTTCLGLTISFRSISL